MLFFLTRFIKTPFTVLQINYTFMNFKIHFLYHLKLHDKGFGVAIDLRGNLITKN